MEQTDFYTAALQKAAEASRRSIREEAGDYYENGLLFCGKCRTKKEHVISCGAFTKPVRCLCECAQKKREEEERERLRQIAAERLLERRRACFFTPRLCECTFSNSDGDTGTAGRAALRYAEAFSSIRGMEALNGLLLYGPVGSGKSYLAAAVANRLLDDGYRVRMTGFSRLVNELGASFSGRQERLDELNDSDLLIIDDLAAERETEYMNEVVLQVIDMRATSKKPLIVTTNLTAEKLKNPETEAKRRVYSRLLSRCMPVPVNGPDRRRRQLAEHYSDMQAMLQL